MTHQKLIDSYLCYFRKAVHLDAAAASLASRRAWNLEIILSRGGQLSLIMGESANSCIHAASNGNLSSSTIFRPATSSNMLIMLASHPKARSTNPILSPPKNLFPFSSSSKNWRCSMASSIASSCSFPSLKKTPQTIDVKTYIPNKTNEYGSNSIQSLYQFRFNQVTRTTLSSPNLAQKRAMALS